MEIDGIGPILPAPLARPTSPEGPATSFADTLEAALREIHESGPGETPHLAAAESTAPVEVTISADDAAIAFDLLVEIRDRLLDGYREIQRMQV